MGIHFTKAQLDQVRENHVRFFEGTLKRPLVSIVMHGAYQRDRETAAPFLCQATCHDFSYTPEQIVDTLDAVLSTQKYLGDGYPRVNMDAFGPGVLAACCGAKLDNSSGQVWFFPPDRKDIKDIRVRYDPENIWVKRIREIYRAGSEKWDGNVVMSMPDLGGVLDVAAVFRGTENLLTDLYDEPDEVLRLCWEIRTAWREAYMDFSKVMPQTGFTDWAGLLSDKPSYILQSDFSFMIGEDMFRRFVLPDVRSDTEWLSHSIYHLDGIGALQHLDSLLSLPRLEAVQWVYGAGQPGLGHWLDVYRRIRDAGKGMMILGSPGEMCEIAGILGAEDMYYHVDLSAGDTATAEALLKL
ncbi:MAG: hypothetical protein J6023_06095 [Clostridia bacterium]|nr:hypothetical protein [Clostridia bacterium]